jgi:hypothetical protein
MGMAMLEGRRAGPPPRRARLLPFTAGASAKGQAGGRQGCDKGHTHVEKVFSPIAGITHLYNN